MAQFSTLHLFSYGETQLIASSSLPQGKVNSSSLTHLEPFVTHIKTFKPEEITEGEHHAIHIFQDSKVKFLGKGDNTSYSLEVSQLDATLLDNLTNEIVSSLPSE